MAHRLQVSSLVVALLLVTFTPGGVARLHPSVSAAPPPTATPTLPAPTPSPLPIFTPSTFKPGVAPQTYITSTCEYLRQRWDPTLSAPGTIVAPFMFHSVVKAGRSIQAGDTTSITAAYFTDFMQHAHDLGFETITADQLVDFLEHNAKIPPRSMILIVDDRRPGVVREHFLPYLEKFNWSVTLGYITGPAPASEWQQLETLVATGHIDMQVHGFLHNGSTYFVPETPKTTVLRELYAPIPLIYAHLGTWPVAFIWPGGNFTQPSVDVAQQAHYHLGFTAFARGPLFYNWVPQGIEERALSRPLMLLPRYWSTAAYYNLDEAVQLSEQAEVFADQHKAEELAYQREHCGF